MQGKFPEHLLMEFLLLWSKWVLANRDVDLSAYFPFFEIFFLYYVLPRHYV
jgi:hypothetical protein